MKIFMRMIKSDAFTVISLFKELRHRFLFLHIRRGKIFEKLLLFI